MKQLAGIFLLLFVLGALAGCASRRNMARTEIKAAARADALFNALLKHQAHFDWFAGKARVKTQSDDFQAGATIHLRMQRDSLIWARVEKFGFEIGRAFIDADSAFVIDRLNKEFYAESLQEFTAQYKAPFSFSDLQDVLSGGALLTRYDAIASHKEKTFHVLTLTSGTLTATHWFDRELLLHRSRVVDQDGRTVTITYGDYRQNGSGQIPYELSLEFDDLTGSSAMTFNFSQINVDVPQSIRFSIPQHYAKVD